MLNATKYINAPDSTRARILSRYTVADNGCWHWNGSLTRDGYAQTVYRLNGHQFSVYPHVLAYLVHNGPLVEGMQIDHRCHDPRTCFGECLHTRCINPAHLVQMTEWANRLRSLSPAALNVAKTTCPLGHPYDTAEANGYRRCSICRRAQRRRTG